MHLDEMLTWCYLLKLCHVVLGVKLFIKYMILFLSH